MPTHWNIYKCKYKETKVDCTETIKTWQPHKQRNKEKGKETSKHEKTTTTTTDYARSQHVNL